MDIGSSGISRRGFVKGATAGLGLTALAGTAAADLLTASASRTLGAHDVLRMARVWVTSREEGALLALFDDTHHVFDDGSYEVLLWPGDLARLQASGLRFDITVEDVVARDRAVLARADQQTSFTGRVPGDNKAYRTLDEYNRDLAALVTRFPDHARLITLPNRSREGRTVLGIEIAKDVAKVDGRPVWYMDGIHHAREWPSGENTIMFAFELLENPQKDERVTALFEGTRTILVPVVNPDGFSWSRMHGTTTSNNIGSLPFAATGQADYWRKNRYSLVEQATVPAPVQRNPLATGVDINRNYSARWGGPGAGSSPESQTYRGPGPLSEPEIRNVAELLRARQPIAVNSNHTYTGLVLRPWGFSGGSARYSPDEDLMRDLGQKMSDANGYRNIHSFDLYVTTGTMTDWAYAALGSLSYCFEIGFSNFHPDYAGGDGPLHHYTLNREGFLLLGESALHQEVTYEGVPVIDKSNPNQHRRTDQVTTQTYKTHSVIEGSVVDAEGNPVQAELVVARETTIPLGAGGGNGQYKEPSRAVSATDAAGTFSWHLPPSTTPVAKENGRQEAWVLTAKAGGKEVSTSVVVDRGETKKVALQL